MSGIFGGGGVRIVDLGARLSQGGSEGGGSFDDLERVLAGGSPVGSEGGVMLFEILLSEPETFGDPRDFLGFKPETFGAEGSSLDQLELLELVVLELAFLGELLEAPMPERAAAEQPGLWVCGFEPTKGCSFGGICPHSRRA